MKNTLLLAALIFCACGGPAAGTAIRTDGQFDPNVATAARELPADPALEQKIRSIAERAKGTVGVYAAVIETGESVALNADERYPMQSVYKLPIGMAVIEQLRKGELTLDQKIKVDKSEYVRQGMHSPLRDKNPNGAVVTVRELLRLAVSESDGTASDVLMRLAGGASAIQAYLASIGVKDMIVADTEMQIGKDWETQYRNWATPKAAVELLHSLKPVWTAGADDKQSLLMKLITETPTGPNRIKGLLPKGTTVAHKTGTGGTRGGVASATNDIGVIFLPDGRHLAIAVFVKDSRVEIDARERVIAEIAKAAYDHWAKDKNEKAVS